MRLPALLAALAAAALASCATAGGHPIEMSPAPAGPDTGEFTPQGEVLLSAGPGGAFATAAFDDRRVRGPNVNVSRNADGTWSGTLAGEDVLLAAGPGRLSGSNVTISIERVGDAIQIGGLYWGIRFRVELSPKRVSGTFGPRSLDMHASGPGRWVGVGMLRLTGAASDLAHPVMPQLALAILAAGLSR